MTDQTSDQIPDPTPDRMPTVVPGPTPGPMTSSDISTTLCVVMSWLADDRDDASAWLVQLSGATRRRLVREFDQLGQALLRLDAPAPSPPGPYEPAPAPLPPGPYEPDVLTPDDLFLYDLEDPQT